MVRHSERRKTVSTLLPTATCSARNRAVWRMFSVGSRLCQASESMNMYRCKSSVNPRPGDVNQPNVASREASPTGVVDGSYKPKGFSHW